MVVNVTYLEIREVVGRFAGSEQKEVEDKLTEVGLKEVVAMFIDLELQVAMLTDTETREFEGKLMGTEQFGMEFVGLVVLGVLLRELLLLVGVVVLVEMLTAFFVLLIFFNSFSSLFFSSFNSFKSSLYFLTVFERLSFFCSTL